MDNLTLCLPRPSNSSNLAPVVVVSPKPSDSLPENSVLLRVDRFGFSANNITYQTLGEHPHFRYFDFHPTPQVENVSPKTHGLVPVWGFATVVASTNTKIDVGERVYGYLAPCRYLLVPVAPTDINKHAFYVARPHLPPDRRPYNQFLRCSTDPQYIPTEVAEDFTMLYRPLFWTSYWCEDWLALSNFRGASTIIVSSASSKTAFCLAYLIRNRRNQHGLAIKVVGLTSKRNLAFTKKLGLYAEVLDYDTFTSSKCLESGKFLYVDVAGNNSLNERITTHFNSKPSAEVVAFIALGYSSVSPTSSSELAAVGWKTPILDPSSSIETLPSSPANCGPPSVEHFFMVEWLEVRRHQLHNNEIFRRQNEAWASLMKDCTAWVKIERVYGAREVMRAYNCIADGQLGPETGYIWSLWDLQDSSNRMRTQPRL